VLVCVGIFLFAWRRRRRAGPDMDARDDAYDEPTLDLRFAYGGDTPLVVRALLTGVAVGVGTAFVSRAWIGAVAAVATIVVVLHPQGRVVVATAIPLALALSRVLEAPELAWLTIALVVVDLAARWIRTRTRSHARAP